MWLGHESRLDAIDWGWKIKKNQVHANQDNLTPSVPDTLLKIVHWNWKTVCTSHS